MAARDASHHVPLMGTPVAAHSLATVGVADVQ